MINSGSLQPQRFPGSAERLHIRFGTSRCKQGVGGDRPQLIDRVRIENISIVPVYKGPLQHLAEKRFRIDQQIPLPFFAPYSLCLVFEGRITPEARKG